MNLLFFVVIPLAAAFLIALLGSRFKNFGCIIANLACLILLAFSLNSIHLVSVYKTIAYKIGGWFPPLGICLVLDGLSCLMLVAVSLISCLVMLYSGSYMERYTDKWKFYSLFMLMQAGLYGVILSGDLFNLYLFLELTSIAAYVLVSFGTDAEDLEAAFKYAIIGSVASLFILLGIALIYSYASTLNMADISLVLGSRPKGLIIGFISVLFLAGFGMKAAIVPFHAWLPDAHSSAPSPVSAMLSGIVIKSLGLYALARIFFNIIGVSPQLLFVLMILGILSMVLGAVLAIGQDDIKRMFAYSSISQIGYIVFAFGIGTPLALLGGLFHLFNHAVFKSLLFLNAGSIEYSTEMRDLKKLGGLNSQLPVTGGTGLLGSMSISGIPPLSGFWSKLIIIIAACQAHYFGFALIAVLVSIITLAYYLKFQTLAFFGKPVQTWGRIKECPLPMKIAMIILSIICLAAGILLIPALRPFLESAVNVLLSGTGYKDAVFSAIRL